MSRPAEKPRCGCRAELPSLDWPYHSPGTVYCKVHAAAPELREALRNLLEVAGFAVEKSVDEAYPAFENARNILAKLSPGSVRA